VAVEEWVFWAKALAELAEHTLGLALLRPVAVVGLAALMVVLGLIQLAEMVDSMAVELEVTVLERKVQLELFGEKAELTHLQTQVMSNGYLLHY
jgi:hypothetical protein